MSRGSDGSVGTSDGGGPYHTEDIIRGPEPPPTGDHPGRFDPPGAGIDAVPDVNITRPAPEHDILTQAWARRPGVRGWIGQCNHKAVGRRFIYTAIFFFVIGGILALAMRAQLAVPDNDLLGAQVFNEFFSMHGTIMMFLFVVPILEGFAIYFAPLQVGARDMPMPRLNAFGYWAYLFGALFFVSSFFFGEAPDGGWYFYVPFTTQEFSPGFGQDFWLLGVTFIEISGVIAAIEVIVLVLRSRAPGMTLPRMPVFSWASLITSIMILSAFPPLIAASTMLELERKLGTSFYNPAGGGDPFLWQHLFWWFGHPEVYIQFLPALGIVGTVIPVAARRSLAGRTWYIASLVAIAILSFGLWVHHMFTIGISTLAMSFFSAASFMITIPTGIIIFLLIATLWRGDFAWSVPLLFCFGFLVSFVNGGITGVMVAIIPFNWQVHDTYFVVAHFHYTLIGGSMMPIFAGLYFWLPKMTGRLLHRGLGLWSFWLTFIGFNATFLIQHVLGFLGMPRRIWTYEAGLGWDLLNLISSAGAFVMGAGVACAVFNFVWFGGFKGRPAGNDPWGGATLDWATTSPPEGYNFREVPDVRSGEPLWDDAPLYPQPHPDELAWHRELVEPTEMQREVLITTGIDARPEHIAIMPGYSIWPFVVPFFISVFLAGVLIDSVLLIIPGLIGFMWSWIAWLWPTRLP
jgi:cytochrome c oxidase subunit I+III